MSRNCARSTDHYGCSAGQDCCAGIAEALAAGEVEFADQVEPAVKRIGDHVEHGYQGVLNVHGVVG